MERIGESLYIIKNLVANFMVSGSGIGHLNFTGKRGRGKDSKKVGTNKRER